MISIRTHVPATDCGMEIIVSDAAQKHEATFGDGCRPSHKHDKYEAMSGSVPETDIAQNLRTRNPASSRDRQISRLQP